MFTELKKFGELTNNEIFSPLYRLQWPKSTRGFYVALGVTLSKYVTYHGPWPDSPIPFGIKTTPSIHHME
jgi:hypothetical protein